jgi:hypothetical protein
MSTFIEQGSKADSFAWYLESEEQYEIARGQQNDMGGGNETGAEVKGLDQDME